MFENVMWLVAVAGGPLLLVILMAFVVATRPGPPNAGKATGRPTGCIMRTRVDPRVG